MTCSCFLSMSCFDGNCPRALYYEYGSDFGDLIPCNECGYHTGECADCSGCACPLEYVLAEALPAYDYYDGVRW